MVVLQKWVNPRAYYQVLDGKAEDRGMPCALCGVGLRDALQRGC